MNTSHQSGTIVIAGGSGFLGLSLASHLANLGRDVVILSRHPPLASGPWRHVAWDGRTVGNWKLALEMANGLVNLTGRSVDCIKTPDHKDEILRSRVEATLVLGRALREIKTPPPVWVQMSTAHIYGDPPTAVCTEDSPPGIGFAPLVGKAWENAFYQSVLPSQRSVIFRTSFVVGRNRGAGGGALSRLVTIARFGLGGTVGAGDQGMSWIHELDMNRLFERALNDRQMTGTYIASSPTPLAQAEFMKTLRRTLGIPIGLPAPSWLVRIGAPLLMRTDPELALYGRYVVSRRLQEEGFSFQFPDLAAALKDLLQPKPE